MLRRASGFQFGPMLSLQIQGQRLGSNRTQRVPNPHFNGKDQVQRKEGQIHVGAEGSKTQRLHEPLDLLARPGSTTSASEA